MTDRYDENLLLDYVEGELDPAGLAKVQAWMRADPQLERLLLQMIADRSALRSLPDPAAPGWLMEEVDRQLEREMLVGDRPGLLPRQASAAEQRFKLRRWSTAAAVAAMLAIVTGLVVWSVTPARRWEPPPSRVADSSVNKQPTASERDRAIHPAKESAELARPPERIAPDPSPQPAVADIAETTDIRPEPRRDEPTMASLPWKIDVESLLAGPVLEDRGAQLAATEPPQPGPRLFGRVDQPIPESLLILPGTERDRPPPPLVTGNEELAQLSRQLAAQPQFAQRCRIEIVTRNADRTRDLLSELSGGDDDAAGSRLHIRPDELARAIEALRSDAAHAAVRLYRPAGPASPAPPAPGAEPDYARILSDQLPLAESEKPRPVMLSIPVVIVSP